jgi:MYXO-CTERM domain-containing protein
MSMKLSKVLAATALAAASSITCAAPAAVFTIEGDTFSSGFAISNQSSADEHITRIAFNIAPAGMVFDTVNGGLPNSSSGSDFRPFSGDAGLTGFIPPLTNPALADGSSLLEMFFNGDTTNGDETFDSGETFRWNVDVDPADPNGDVTVFGNQLIGAVVTIDFDNGRRLTGTMRAWANHPQGAELILTGNDPIPPTNPTPEPGSLALAGLGLLAAGALRRRS